MKKVLIVNTNQLGTLTDTLKYCEYLRNDYELTILCYDYGYERVKYDNVKVVYVPHPSSRLFQGVFFLLFSLWKCFLFHGSIFIVYFPYCKYLKRILFWKYLHVDIRTLSVSNNKEQREKYDKVLEDSILQFDSVSCVSQGVLNKLALKKEQKTFILPLGADIMSYSSKEYKSLRLLYVGTLTNRNIIKTLIGLKNYKEKNPCSDIKYDIIGDGDEIAEIREYVCTNGMEEMCLIHGRLSYSELKPFFEKCNVGVSFIPITDYYQYQPPTKTFEYGLSGLITIATCTIANKEVIKAENGVLINDSADDFMHAIEIIEKSKGFDSNIIRNSMKDYRWDVIVNKYLVPILEKSS